MSDLQKTNIPTETSNSLLRSRTRNLIHQKFGRFLVVSFSHYNGRDPYWNCICDCGVQKIVCGRSMIRGESKSCGCYNREMTKLKNSTHGMSKSKSRIYKIWTGMIQRCTNEKMTKYEDYGGRGIKVCDRWVKSFENFLQDVGERPSQKHTLDRIEVNGNYEPGNVKWATRKEQQQNRRDSIKLTINGQAATISQWSAISGTPYQTISTRYFRKWNHFECVYGRNLDRLN